MTIKEKMESTLCSYLTTCKICNHVAQPYGAADFNKSCEEQRGIKIADSGVSIAYQRCPHCGFVFTNAFDTWNDEEFKAYIYNKDYIRVDPDYGGKRAATDADTLDKLFPRKEGIVMLDYGGGSGALAKLLAQRGYAAAETYDPLLPAFATAAPGTYNLVTCFETLEHMPDPVAGVTDLVRFVGDGGIVIFSTLTPTPAAEKIGIDWWYIAPRNGHISIFSMTSLKLLWQRQGFKFGSFNGHLHIAWRDRLPAFADHINVGQPASP